MLVLVGLVAALAVYVLYRYHQRHLELRRITAHFNGPKPHYLLGNVLDFLHSDIPAMFDTAMGYHKRFGPDVALYGAFNEFQLNISSTKNVEKVLLAKTSKKPFIYDFLNPWLGTGLLVASGAKWFQRRRIITPAFHFKVLEQFLDVFSREGDILVKKLKTTAGRVVDMYECVSLYALDNICETSMGVSVKAQDNPDNDYVQAVKQMSVIVLLRAVTVLRRYPSLFFLYPMAWRQKRLVKRLHQFTNSVIDKRRVELQAAATQSKKLEEDETYSKKRLTFLDLLLSTTVDGEPLSQEDIREEVDTFMFEGHDTTTSGIAFTAYMLALHQDVQQRLYEEIENLLGKEKDTTSITTSLLQDFKYLEAVIKESMRLLPPVPMIGRELMEDLELNGCKVPAGTTIMLMIYNLHRNPEVYPDPERFDPERFSDDYPGKREPYDFIPFSIGSRNCIGQRYAMLQMKVSLIKLVTNFTVLPGDGCSLHNLRLQPDLVLRPAGELPLKFLIRDRQ